VSIEERLARLERENRRLKVAGLLVLLMAASVFLMGQARPAQRITAQAFTLTDQGGAIIGEFKVNDTGMPVLTMYYPDQAEPTIALRLYENVVQLPAERQGEITRSAAMMVNRPNGTGGVNLDAAGDRASVQVLDAHNSVIAQVSSYGDYDGSITLQRVGPRPGAFPDNPVQTIFRVP
jgi:hypothetical protein